MNLSWRDVGLKSDRPVVQMSLALLGLPLGYAEYWILRPGTLTEALTIQVLRWPSLVNAISIL